MSDLSMGERTLQSPSSSTVVERPPLPRGSILDDVRLVEMPVKPKREDVPADRVLCESCTAKCCRYFALPIDTPDTREELEYVRWFLLHDQATVFVEDDDWYVCVHTVCKHLQDDNRCGIYETRPQICREYTTKDCEYEDDWVYDRFFETPEQVEEYMDAVLGLGGEEVGEAFRKKSLRRSIRSPKPPLLPIL
ncbi:MAG: YkgJ family cysteine cluster protein [Planctomycetaceae bacterium]